MAQAILLDIEGTTTPIAFVHNTLFPFAKSRIAGYVQQNLSDLKFEIGQLAEECEADTDYKPELRIESANSVSDYMKFLIDSDRKSTPLKSIQGMIWRTGYESGDLVSVVYPDVAAAMIRWKEASKTIAIYSSGSVLAQQMIFKYSDQGDLTRYIDRYFDTTAGHKRERESYAKIAKELDLSTGEILFVSDIPEELDAAAQSGCQTALSVRDGNAPIETTHSHSAFLNFDVLE